MAGERGRHGALHLGQRLRLADPAPSPSGDSAAVCGTLRSCPRGRFGGAATVAAAASWAEMCPAVLGGAVAAEVGGTFRGAH